MEPTLRLRPMTPANTFPDNITQLLTDLKQTLESIPAELANDIQQLRSELNTTNIQLTRLQKKIDENQRKTQFDLDSMREFVTLSDFQSVDVQNDLEELKARAKHTTKMVTDVFRRFAKDSNAMRSSYGPLLEVPFPDGTMPWNQVVDVRTPTSSGVTVPTRVTLPPICNSNDVEALTKEQVLAYYQGYYPDEVVTAHWEPVSYRKDIIKALGCQN